MNGMCHCGRPLHYPNIATRAFMELVVASQGEYIRITVAGRTWLVQRHYAALHGIVAAKLPSLGFEEVK